MFNLRSLFSTLLAAICCVVPLLAQESAVSTGSVVGVLKDPSGAVVADARVELRSTTTSLHQTKVSDHLGHFSFVSVPAGNYQLTVTASGFASQVIRPLAVVSDTELSEDLSLKIAVVAADIQVEGQDASSIAASNLKVQAPNSSQSHNSADMLADVPGVSLHGNGELATIPFLHGLEPVINLVPLFALR